LGHSAIVIQSISSKNKSIYFVKLNPILVKEIIPEQKLGDKK